MTTREAEKKLGIDHLIMSLQSAINVTEFSQAINEQTADKIWKKYLGL